MTKINVQGIEISYKKDYISLTDIAKKKNSEEPRFVVINWLRNRNTIEFLGIGKKIHNPEFNRVGFDTVSRKIKNNYPKPKILYICYINRYNMASAKSFMDKKNILRYPRLDTVLMVEDFIKSNNGEYKKRKLWETLPKKMMYQTFQVIINYLLYSKRISIDSEGKIGWIYYPETARKYYNQKELSRKK